MRALVPILAMLITAGCGGADGITDENEIARIADTRLVLPVMPGRPGALYFTLQAGREPVTLLSIEGDQIGRVDLHQTVHEGNVSRMVGLYNPVAAPGAALRFEPGGLHAMLVGVDPMLKAGDRVRLTFRIEPGGPVEFETEARSGGDAGPVGH